MEKNVVYGIFAAAIISIGAGGYFFWLTTIDTDRKHLETISTLDELEKNLIDMQKNSDSNPEDIKELEKKITELENQNNDLNVVKSSTFDPKPEPTPSEKIQLYGPEKYLSFDDSPFLDMRKNSEYFYLLDFEDQVINVPGVKAINGVPIFDTPQSLNGVDSVDFDDGYLDGVGRGGSYNYEYVPYGEFEFDQNILGKLPTHVGFVVTDADWNVTVTIEVFGPNGAKLEKKFESVAVGDQISQAGETAEDVFFGFMSSEGIKKIKITIHGNAIEIDHLQYGR